MFLLGKREWQTYVKVRLTEVMFLLGREWQTYVKVRLTEVMFLLGKRMADICEGKID